METSDVESERLRRVSGRVHGHAFCKAKCINASISLELDMKWLTVVALVGEPGVADFEERIRFLQTHARVGVEVERGAILPIAVHCRGLHRLGGERKGWLLPCTKQSGAWAPPPLRR